MDQSLDYNYKVVKQFAIATIVWGVVGMLVGVIIAAQLAWPSLNLDIPWLTYGRLRPLHTNAVIFAFGISGFVRYFLLCRATYLPGTPVLRQAGRLHLLGLASRDHFGGDHLTNGFHPRQGIR